MDSDGPIYYECLNGANEAREVTKEEFFQLPKWKRIRNQQAIMMDNLTNAEYTHN